MILPVAFCRHKKLLEVFLFKVEMHTIFEFTVWSVFYLFIIGEVWILKECWKDLTKDQILVLKIPGSVWEHTDKASRRVFFENWKYGKFDTFIGILVVSCFVNIGLLGLILKMQKADMFCPWG